MSARRPSLARAALACAALLPPALGQQTPDAGADRWGHSRHGAAFDEGPRQRPWRMQGIGDTPFPISSAHPEVQGWFDQGNALLHGFWWYEAERAFRWCVKLDPECAMAYWGLARCDEELGERGRAFLAQASARKQHVTPRERAYIELYEAKAALVQADEDERAAALERFVVRFDELLMEHPDDLEAKALYWGEMSALVDSGAEPSPVRYGMEAVFRDVLAVDPDHVGVLHYRVHNWDGKQGRYAVDSCLALSAAAPNCGHLQHMPGHVLSGVGLWHEAAIAMDAATRVEKAYMRERMILPEQNWDYVHNLDYLCYIQEQLGMVEAALFGAQQLLLGPPPTEDPWLAAIQKLPLVRALLKFERWEQVLDGTLLAWDDEVRFDDAMRAFAEGRAHLGLGHLDEAAARLEQLEELRAELEADAGAAVDPEDAWWMQRVSSLVEVQEQGLRGLLELARGEALTGIRTLTEAAERQERDWWNDPPQQPGFLFNALGEAYLELGSPRLAAAAFERTLETVFNDGFALAGLVQARAALGDEQGATAALGALKVVWSDADAPNRWLEAALATGLDAAPHLEAPVRQRNYKREVLDVLGPSRWEPTPAPALAARDSAGAPVTLEDYAGQNVVLIFYLGEQCLHCVEQLQAAAAQQAEFEALNTAVVAVSKDAPAAIAAYEQASGTRLALLSDPGFESARRFHAYDDFEEAELHATFLIDARGRVHWSRIGGAPFMDFDWLAAEARRLEEGVVRAIRGTAAR